MGIRTEYAPGAFCWTGLASTDLPKACDFYSKLFGWELRDESTETITAYAALVDGRWATALTSPAAGVTESCWNMYVRVDDADVTVARVRELGGEAAVVPAPVSLHARTATVVDPQGVSLRLLEPASFRGAEVLNQVAALSWFELLSPDRSAAGAYYSDLFGWTTEPVEGGPIDHEVIMNGPEQYNGQISPLLDEVETSRWIPYFGTGDIVGSHARALELGASSLLAPLEVTEGQITAIVRDPQGAVFGLCQYAFEEFE
jgi:predicted enzyme related to lactoylglutathione lyase